MVDDMNSRIRGSNRNVHSNAGDGILNGVGHAISYGATKSSSNLEIKRIPRGNRIARSVGDSRCRLIHGASKLGESLKTLAWIYSVGSG